MKIPQLGTLEEVELRQAWSHEAHSFTPGWRNISTIWPR